MSENKCILNPAVDCLGLIRAEELAKDIQHTEQDLIDLREHNEKNHKEYFDRLALLEAHNKVQDAHYEHIIEKLTNINDQLTGLCTRITAIEAKPGKRWEGIVEQLIGIVVATVVGFMLAKFGM